MMLLFSQFNFRIFLLLITSLFLIQSCGKSDSTTTPNPNTIDSLPNCDVVGYSYNGTHYIAKYWKNGVETKLSSGVDDVKAFSLSVSGNDVFIAGEYRDPNTYYNLPKLWKNGNEIAMNVVYPGAGVDKNCRGYAKSIATYNGNSYTAGYITDGGGSFALAVLWVNGGAPQLLCPRFDQDLNNGSSYARAVFVTNAGEIYVAGEQYIGPGLGNRQIVMWKNGVKTQITNYTADVNGFPGEVSSIFVSGGDVYISCSYTATENGISLPARAAYLKNGNLVLVSDPSETYTPTSIFVVNNDVYLSGFKTNSLPYLWKNNQAQALSTLKVGGRIHKVFIKNGDVYGCGYSDNKSKAVVWKNNKIFPLTDGTETNIATDIFIR